MPVSMSQCLNPARLRPGPAALALLAALAAAPPPASAHQAVATASHPDGWTYPVTCCSNHDCRLVPASRISERPQGYVVNATGEVIAYGDPKVRHSPDGEFHWCSVNGAEDGRTICLFAPPRGF